MSVCDIRSCTSVQHARVAVYCLCKHKKEVPQHPQRRSQEGLELEAIPVRIN